MRAFAIYLTLLSMPLCAQVATSSFDPAALSVNPAVLPDRLLAGIILNYNYNKVSALTEVRMKNVPAADPTDARYEDRDWEEIDTITSKNAVVVGKKYYLVPEIFFSQQKGTKETTMTDLTGGGTDSYSYTHELDNMQFALATNIIPYLSLGIKKISIDFDSSFSGSIIDSAFTQTSVSSEKTKYDGISYGTSLDLPLGFHLGYEITKIEIEGSYTYSSTTTFQSGGDTETIKSSYEGDSILERKRRSFGVAWIWGDPKTKALKIEYSKEKMNSPRPEWALDDGAKYAFYF